MRYYPISIRVGGRRCLVVGGGPVAERKIEALLRCDAAVEVVSPQVTARIEDWARSGQVTLHRRPYESADLSGAVLAIAATNDSSLHERLAREAAVAGTLLNVVDVPELCTFIVPAVCERGDLSIAVSTNGTSPALAQRIRHDLDDRFGTEYETALLILGRLRQRLSAAGLPADARRRIFGSLVDSPMIERLRSRILPASIAS